MQDLMVPSSGSLKDLEECELFVGICGHRYGSLTEQEYEHAKKLKKQRFCFIVDGNHAWPPSMIDNDEPARSKLRSLKAKIRGDLVIDVFTTENLAYKVATSVCRYIASRSKGISTIALDPMKGDYQNLKQKHQNEDIKPVFECWINASLCYAEYIYPLYVTISNLESCDRYGEDKMHLKSGYPEINTKADLLQSRVDGYNHELSNYVQLINDRINNEILRLAVIK